MSDVLNIHGVKQGVVLPAVNVHGVKQGTVLSAMDGP